LGQSVPALWLLTPLRIVAAVIEFAHGNISPHWETRAVRLDGDFFPPRYFASHEVTNAWIAAGRAKREAGEITLEQQLDLERPYVLEAVARPQAEAQIYAERQYAIEVLDQAAQGLTAISTWFRKGKNRVYHKHTPSISFTPYLNPAANGLIDLIWRMTGPNSRSQEWVELAGAMAAKAAKGEQTDVGRCQLESCRKFFLIDWHSGNRPRTKYCCQEHRLENNASQATERKRKLRVRKAAAAAAKKKPSRRRPK
jgi:hypothetical protein